MTTCLPAGEWALDGIDIVKVMRNVNFLNLMAYDFAGPWNPLSGHHAQLYAPDGTDTPSGHAAVRYLLSRGANPRKLLLGIPAYGRSFVGADGPDQGYTECAGDDGTFDYRDLPRPGAVEGYDEDAVAAFCVGDHGGFVSYDTPETVRVKGKYVRATGLGGLYYWHGVADNVEESLVQAGWKALKEYERPS